MKTIFAIFIIIAVTGITMSLVGLMTRSDTSSLKSVDGNTNVVDTVKEPTPATNGNNKERGEALRKAVVLQDVEGVRKALQDGAGVNTIVSVEGPNGENISAPVFFMAVVIENTNIIKLFLEYDVDLEAKGSFGETVIIHAVLTGKLSIVKLIIDGGVNVNATMRSGITPLMLAAGEPGYQILQLLLENGADKAIMSDSGKRAIDFAINAKNEDAIFLLQ